MQRYEYGFMTRLSQFRAPLAGLGLVLGVYIYIGIVNPAARDDRFLLFFAFLLVCIPIQILVRLPPLSIDSFGLSAFFLGFRVRRIAWDEVGYVQRLQPTASLSQVRPQRPDLFVIGKSGGQGGRVTFSQEISSISDLLALLDEMSVEHNFALYAELLISQQRVNYGSGKKISSLRRSV